MYVTGGDGNDDLNTANGSSDQVDCGAGIDSVQADYNDWLTGCE